MSLDYVDRWIAVLGGLLSPLFPAEAIEPLAKSYGGMLRREFPEWAFTKTTAMKVAEAKRFGPIPSWDVIAGVLRQHVRDWRPIVTALPAPREPERGEPTEEEKARVAALAAEARSILAAKEAAKPPVVFKDVSLPRAVLAQLHAQADRRRNPG